MKKPDIRIKPRLLECRRAAVFENRGFVVKALPPALSSLAGLYGVQELLPAL